MGGVLPYKWEAYCRVSLSSKLRSQESTAIQMGGVLPYKWEVCCRTFQTSCTGWGFRNIAHLAIVWKSKFLYLVPAGRHFSDFFFGLILDPPPPRYICFYSEKRQIHLYRPFFPHGMAFLEKRGGLVPVFVFIFPGGLPGPSGPKYQKSLENVSRGLRPRNPEKSPKSLGNSLGSLRKVSKESFRTVPETVWRLFGVPGARGLGDIFETFSAFRARRARETSVRGGLVRRSQS